MRTPLLATVSASIALGASYGMVSWSLRHDDPNATEQAASHGQEQKKLRTINVPVLADGHVQGYVVAQFLYTADQTALKALPSPPDPIILDEAFRMLYGEEKLDFSNLKRIDLGKLAADLKERVARRMNSNVVQNIFVQEFNYVSRDELRK